MDCSLIPTVEEQLDRCRFFIPISEMLCVSRLTNVRMLSIAFIWTSVIHTRRRMPGFDLKLENLGSDTPQPRSRA